MARAGHADFAPTKLYIDLVGETFREEAERLERRVFVGMGTRSGYKNAADEAAPVTESAS